MDRIINYSFSLDSFYDHYPFLAELAVNRYQLITVAWNIFLVFLALLFYVFLKSLWRDTGLRKISQKAAAVILFILWLIFIPNAAYIITDVRHLLNYCPLDSPNKVCVANAWMIIFFFTYAGSGWVSFYYLLKSMSNLLNEIFKRWPSDFFVALVIPITSLGVLVGLLNRFNSWDVFLFPLWLLRVLSVYFSNLDYFLNWLIFTVFLYLLYFSGDAIFKSYGLSKDKQSD